MTLLKKNIFNIIWKTWYSMVTYVCTQCVRIQFLAGPSSRARTCRTWGRPRRAGTRTDRCHHTYRTPILIDCSRKSKWWPDTRPRLGPRRTTHRPRNTRTRSPNSVIAYRPLVSYHLNKRNAKGEENLLHVL